MFYLNMFPLFMSSLQMLYIFFLSIIHGRNNEIVVDHFQIFDSTPA